MATGSIMPFAPTGTVSLAASATSSNVALAGGGDSIVVTNTSAALAYVRFGSDAGVAASTSDMPVLANSRVMLGVNSLITYAAAVLSSGSGAVLFSRGGGSYL